MKIWLTLFGILVSQLVWADQMQWEVTQQLHPHMVPFRFELWTNHDTEFEPFAYLVIRTPSGEEIHRINSMHLNQKPESLAFIDAKFDGTLALRVDNNSFSERDQYWLYDSSTARFTESKALGELQTPVFDEKNKQIINKWQEEKNQTTDYYQFQGNELVLMKQVMIQCQADNQCEKVEWHNKEGILAETNREAVNYASKVQDYLDNLISRKGLCLANITDFEHEGKREQGIEEARTCLNALAFDVMPVLYDTLPNQQTSPTKLLQELFDKHYAFIKLITPCTVSDECEQNKENEAKLASIHFADKLIETMVVHIGSQKIHFEQDKWLAKWASVNDIMQG